MEGIPGDLAGFDRIGRCRVPGRRRPFIASEQPDKIARILETALEGNLRNAFLGSGQPMAGLVNPVAVEVFYRGI